MIAFVLLLTSLISLTSAAECPPSEDLSPCTCMKGFFTKQLYVNCKKSDLARVRQSMASLRGIKVSQVHFDTVKFGKLPGDFFNGLNVGYLTFYDCEMTDLTDSTEKPAFSGLEDSLYYLILYNSIQGTMSAPAFSHMKKLKDIEIMKIDILELNADWLAGMPESLEHLGLDGNRITSVGSKALAGLENLQILSLQNQKFDNFGRDILPRPALKLKEINLSFCGLTSLPEDMFADMPSLTYVRISDNEIQKLPSETWSPIWSRLEHLIASDNPLVCDEHIEWMFKTKGPGLLMAECTGPASRAGKNLQDIIDDNLQNEK